MELFKEIFGKEETDPLKEKARPVDIKDLDNYGELVKKTLGIFIQETASLIEVWLKMNEIINARGDRINELIERINVLEAELEVLKTPKKLPVTKTRRKATKGIKSTPYKKGKDALARLKKK